MHSMQAGYMDKAQKYTDKALMQIEKLKSEYSKLHNQSSIHNQNHYLVENALFCEL